MVTQDPDWRAAARQGVTLARAHRGPTAALIGLLLGVVGLAFSAWYFHLGAWAFWALAGYYGREAIEATTTRKRKERDEELEMARRLLQLAREHETEGKGA